MTSFTKKPNMPSTKMPANDAFIERFIGTQQKHYIKIIIISVVILLISLLPAIHLLTNISTSLVDLLDTDDPFVQTYQKSKRVLKLPNIVYLLVRSPSREVNKEVLETLKAALSRNKMVEKLVIQKVGHSFLRENRLMLLDLDDIHKIHDEIKHVVDKKKLKGVYVDFEDEENEFESASKAIDDITQKYSDNIYTRLDSPYIESSDGKIMVGIVYRSSSNNDLKSLKKFVSSLNADIADTIRESSFPGVKVDLMGSLVTRVDEYNAILSDIRWSQPLSIFFIISFICLYFCYLCRGLYKTTATTLTLCLVFSLSVFLPMLFSLILTFAICSLFIHKLNLVTSFMMAIMFGLGVDIGIHLLSRYINERRLGLSDLNTILKSMLQRTGLSCFSGITTTVVVLLALTQSDFKCFSEFGLIAAIGLAISFLSYIVFIPVFLRIIHNRTGRLIRDDVCEINKPAKRNIIKPSYRYLIFLLIPAVLLVSLWKPVDFEWDLRNLKITSTERSKLKNDFREARGRLNGPAFYLIESRAEATKIKGYLKNRMSRNHLETIENIYSYYDLTPYDGEEKLSVWQLIADQIKTILEKKADVYNAKQKEDLETTLTEIESLKPIDENDIPDELSELFSMSTGNTSYSPLFIMPQKGLDLQNGKVAISFLKDIGRHRFFEKDYYAVNDALIYAHVLTQMVENYKSIFIWSAFALVIFLILFYRKWGKVLLISLNMVLSLGAMYFIMGQLGIKFNIYNMVSIPLVVGMGLDSSFHILDRFYEVDQISYGDLFQTSCLPTIAASLTTILGFTGLLLTRHPGLQSLGAATITGLFCTLACSVMLLPLILYFINRRKAF